jgi:hypothetical protein
MYLIAAAKRSEQIRLLRFVRLADYLLTDGLRILISNTLDDLLHKVTYNEELAKQQQLRNQPTNLEGDASVVAFAFENTKASRPQIFEVALIIESDMLCFKPTYHDFENQVLFLHLLKKNLKNNKKNNFNNF